MGYESIIMQYLFHALEFVKILVIGNLWYLGVACGVSLWREFGFFVGEDAEWRQSVSSCLSLG